MHNIGLRQTERFSSTFLIGAVAVKMSVVRGRVGLQELLLLNCFEIESGSRHSKTSIGNTKKRRESAGERARLRGNQ